MDREGVPHAVVGRIGGAGGEGSDVFVMEGERGCRIIIIIDPEREKERGREGEATQPVCARPPA